MICCKVATWIQSAVDNRIENLELWSGSQPRGQRVVDKVAWAREIIRLYGDEFPERPADN